MNNAELIVATLKNAGITHGFGIPSGNVLPIMEAMRTGGIEFVLTAHEGSAGFAADVMGRLTGLEQERLIKEFEESSFKNTSDWTTQRFLYEYLISYVWVSLIIGIMFFIRYSEERLRLLMLATLRHSSANASSFEGVLFSMSCSNFLSFPGYSPFSLAI